MKSAFVIALNATVIGLAGRMIATEIISKEKDGPLEKFQQETRLAEEQRPQALMFVQNMVLNDTTSENRETWQGHYDFNSLYLSSSSHVHHIGNSQSRPEFYEAEMDSVLDAMSARGEINLFYNAHGDVNRGGLHNSALGQPSPELAKQDPYGDASTSYVLQPVLDKVRDNKIPLNMIFSSCSGEAMLKSILVLHDMEHSFGKRLLSPGSQMQFGAKMQGLSCTSPTHGALMATAEFSSPFDNLNAYNVAYNHHLGGDGPPSSVITKRGIGGGTLLTVDESCEPVVQSPRYSIKTRLGRGLNEADQAAILNQYAELRKVIAPELPATAQAMRHDIAEVAGILKQSQSLDDMPVDNQLACFKVMSLLPEKVPLKDYVDNFMLPEYWHDRTQDEKREAAAQRQDEKRRLTRRSQQHAHSSPR